MKTKSFLLVAVISIHQVLAQTTKEPEIVGSGLTLLRYNIQPSQMGSKSVYIPYTELLKLKPKNAPRTVNSISKWKKSVDENAIVIGYIKIEKPGVYGFRTSSDYDVNELIVNNQIVCKIGDGENKSQIIELPKGLLPIVSVGYVTHTIETLVQWLPPGEAQWSDIPNNLLCHPSSDSFK